MGATGGLSASVKTDGDEPLDGSTHEFKVDVTLVLCHVWFEG